MRTRIDNIAEQASTAGALGANPPPSRPMNEIELLHEQNTKLNAVVMEQERELLNLYRRLLERY